MLESENAAFRGSRSEHRSRQNGRDHGRNVLNVDYDRHDIKGAILHQRERNSLYDPEHIYGDGQSGKRIAEILAEIVVSVEKKLVY